MTRDGRDSQKGTFGYNKSGGEYIKINLVTPLNQILANQNVEFYARIFVEGKDKQFGKYYGMYDDNGKLKWGTEGASEVCLFKSIDWS